MDLTRLMKHYNWLEAVRLQPRVEDLRIFLKEHKQKCSGKREVLIKYANDLLGEYGFNSEFWIKKML